MSSSFAVVICHGSFHTPKPYQPFVDALKSAGIDAYCPQLPTSDLTRMNVGDTSNPDYSRGPPPGGYPQPAEAIEVIIGLLKQLVEDGKNILLFGHSSGGFTATASAVPELQFKTRKSQGAEGGIVGIFYAAAFLVPVGESVHSFLQPKDGSPPVIPTFCDFHGGLDGIATIKEGFKYFFNGLDEAEAKYYESTLTASPAFLTVLNNDAYAALPCTYLVAENDLALSATYQEGMVDLQNQRPDVNISVVRSPSGHSPQLAWTEGLVAEVKKFGEALLK